MSGSPGGAAGAVGPLAAEVVDGGGAALEAHAPVVEGAAGRQVAQVQALPGRRRRRGPVVHAAAAGHEGLLAALRGNSIALKNCLKVSLNKV